LCMDTINDWDIAVTATLYGRCADVRALENGAASSFVAAGFCIGPHVLISEILTSADGFVRRRLDQPHDAAF